MPSVRTEVTEIVTGLAMLGLGDLRWALATRPAELLNVTPEHWDRLVVASDDPAHQADFASAWANGLAFLSATDGLRGRPPLRVEWRGPHKLPGVADVPADLRVDHVYLVSCKYLSKILVNPSPPSLFDGCLGERPAATVADWYAEVAPAEYAGLYEAVRAELSSPDGQLSFEPVVLPRDRSQLTREQRDHIAVSMRKTLPPSVAQPYRHFALAVAQASAHRWSAALPDLAARERLLWRMLRIGGAPYYVLGSSRTDHVRLRIDTPWDWRQRYRLDDFDVWGEPAGQPLVKWRATVTERDSDLERHIDGHVEVRWSHGRFSGAPEAKVYLDTPHADVAGYHPLR